MRPVVIASANGNRWKNGGSQTCVERAYAGIEGGEDLLDALIAGATINELDPGDDSVGYGGLPNAEGVVQLDAACMHGPRGWAGGVAALEGVRTPSLVAKAVMEQTDHHLLAGEGAQAFARRQGFAIENDLNSEHSRAKWLEWKRRTDPEHYLDPAQRQWGTLHVSGLNANGDLCALTTTSGPAWKLPGAEGRGHRRLAPRQRSDARAAAAHEQGQPPLHAYILRAQQVGSLRRGLDVRGSLLRPLRRERSADARGRGIARGQSARLSSAR